MESQKSSESTSSSSGEIPERANAKTEKTHQKITLPTFEKRGIQEAKLWWGIFTQYIKMTQNIDLNEMTTDREILPNNRDDLEHRIKDYLYGHWASQRSLKRQELLEIMIQIKWTLTNCIHCSGYTSYRNETNFPAEQISLG